MIKLAYFRLVWRNNKAFAIFSMVFITLLQFLILYLVTTFDTKSIFSVILAQLPEAMRVFLQDSFFSMLNYDGAAAFGFNHPLVLALLVITAVNIPVHHISRELDSGTLELLLAHPFKRSSLIISLWISGGLILMLIIAAAMIGSLTSILLFHKLTSDIFIHIMQIGINLWLFIVLIFSYTTLIAVFGKTGSKAGNYSAIITFVFYLLSFLSQVWSKLGFTKPFNIFTYYEPQALMFNKGNFILDILVLIALILICYGISLTQFGKRDIP
jgi:ABC-type transport system involved in multi-copper enzyme maturation permease subunit